VRPSTARLPRGVSRAEAPEIEHLRRPTWWEGPRMKTRLGIGIYAEGEQRSKDDSMHVL
jgi:hypothetical protein